jgi:hypothetical protein
VNCSGTCITNSTSVTNDGTCTTTCGIAYTQLRSACGDVTNERYGTYSDATCRATSCTPRQTSSCRSNVTALGCASSPCYRCTDVAKAAGYMEWSCVESFATCEYNGDRVGACYMCDKK